jgi:hypothetical protein
MLNERLTGFDFDLTPASARPLVAVPYVAIHVNGLVLQKLCDVTDRNLMRRAALWQVVSKQSEAILPPPPRDRWTRDRYHLNRDISGLLKESSTGSQLSRFFYGRFYKNSAG